MEKDTSWVFCVSYNTLLSGFFLIQDVKVNFELG